MKLEMFMIIGLIVNTLFAVLYPAQIFGDDPLGLNGIKESKLQQYYSVNGSGVIGAYNSVTGELEPDDTLFTDLSGAVSSTDGNAGIFGSDTFGFIDWVKVGWNLLKSALMFVIGFIFMLWSLVYPLNFLIGVPFSILYMFAMVRFIIGR